jgi:cathepsin L
VTVGYDVHVPGEQAMVNHVLTGGTLMAYIDASTWSSYRSGIYSGCKSVTTINHAVQIVGVDVPGGYWILRNSWGTRWGDNGYMKLALVCTSQNAVLTDWLTD